MNRISRIGPIVADPLPILDLSVLGQEPGLPALTASLGKAYADAAAVCLELKEHSQGTAMNVIGLKSETSSCVGRL